MASLAIVAALIAPSATPTAAASAHPCQCMEYVQNYVGHISVLYAKDAGPALMRMGYRQSSTPMGINDVVVLQPGFAGAYSAGHVAFLASYSKSGSTWRVTLRGANQPGGTWTDHGCTNVSQWTFTYTNGWGIRFYRR